MIEAVIVDSREPDWVQALHFGGAPVAVQELAAGDLKVYTQDACILLIERKTPDDLLNTLREERLYPQMERMTEGPVDDLLKGERPLVWPYLMITGPIMPGPGGVAVTDRGQTGWKYMSVMGALLSIQEMGVFVSWCASQMEFEHTVISLANRSRSDIQRILPPRPAVMFGAGAAFLAGLPGVGPERVMDLMKWADNIPAHALVGIVDLEISCPLPINVRRQARSLLGLKGTQTLELWQSGELETLRVMEHKNV